MPSAIRPRTVCVAVAALSVAACLSSTVSAQSYGLQRMNSIDLSSQFFGTAAGSSAYGSSPSSIAFDGTNIYIGGRNDPTTGGVTGPSTVGVVQVTNALSATTAFNPLADTQVTFPTGRGLDSLAYNGDSLYIGGETGSTGDSFVRRYVVGNPGSASNYNVTNPFAGNRVGYIAIDPVGSASSSPIIGGVTFSGSGRRFGLDPANGSLLYGATGSANPGFAISSSNTVYRGVNFDAAGNVIAADDNTVAVGLRTGPNTTTTLDGAGAGSTLALSSNITVNNIGRGVAFLDNASVGNELIVASLRAGATSTVPVLSQTITDSTGGTTVTDPRNILIRNRNGTPISAGALGGFNTGVLTGAEDNFTAAYTGDIKNFATGTLPDGTPVLMVVNLIERRLDVFSLEPTYAKSGDGTWSDTTSWVRGRIADGATNNAKFGDAISAPTTVTLDSNRTIKNLKFDNANRYTINGGGTLTLAAPVNNSTAQLAFVNVINGSHTVGVPITLGSSARVNVNNAADTLTINTIAGNGKVLSKRGAGTLSVQSFRVNTLALDEGKVIVRPNGTEAGLSRVGALTLGTTGTTPTTGTLDLTNNGVIVDYPVAGTNPYADLKAAIAAGRITSSTNTTANVIGIVDYSLAPVPTFGDPALQIDTTSVFVRSTLKGDANLTGKVDFDDLVILAQNYNLAGNALYQQGDSNGDGNVNFDDLVPLAQNYNASISLGQVEGLGGPGFAADWALAQSLAPEPTSLLAIGAGSLLLRRRR